MTWSDGQGVGCCFACPLSRGFQDACLHPRVRDLCFFVYLLRQALLDRVHAVFASVTCEI
jgi:hypothetical protein